MKKHKICVICASVSSAKWYSGPKCKKCYRKEWGIKNKEKEVESRKKYYQSNKEHIRRMRKQNGNNDSEESITKRKLYKQQYYLKNIERIKFSRNKQRDKTVKARYYKNNKAEIHSKRKIWLKKDVSIKIGARLRSRLSNALTNNQKTGSAVKDLGCSIDELKTYLQSKFALNMSWDNYGKWHIDHIKPLSSFDLSIYCQLKQACHYTNLQPLWAEDNLRKGGKYEED